MVEDYKKTIRVNFMRISFAWRERKRETETERKMMPPSAVIFREKMAAPSSDKRCFNFDINVPSQYRK